MDIVVELLRGQVDRKRKKITSSINEKNSFSDRIDRVRKANNSM